MADFPDFLILRHGETAWNVAGRMQGTLDSPLTPQGVAQARRQGAILDRFGVDGWGWVSSPQGRALETARIAGGVDVAADARLAEIDVGRWTGSTRDDIRAERPDLFTAGPLDWYDHAPGGEGLVALATRCAAFLNEQTSPAVIVTHGITSRVLRCLLAGRPVSDYARITGGQGVVYHLSGGISRLLD